MWGICPKGKMPERLKVVLTQSVREGRVPIIFWAPIAVHFSVVLTDGNGKRARRGATEKRREVGERGDPGSP